MKQTIWISATLIYAVLITVSYLLEIDFILLVLTFPWSPIITMFSMLLIHILSYSLNSYLLVGGLVNFILLVRATIKSFVTNEHLE